MRRAYTTWPNAIYIAARFRILHVFKCMRVCYFSFRTITNCVIILPEIEIRRKNEEKKKSSERVTRSIDSVCLRDRPRPHTTPISLYRCVWMRCTRTLVCVYCCHQIYTHDAHAVWPCAFMRRTSGRFFNVFGLWMGASSCWFYSGALLFLVVDFADVWRHRRSMIPAAR